MALPLEKRHDRQIVGSRHKQRHDQEGVQIAASAPRQVLATILPQNFHLEPNSTCPTDHSGSLNLQLARTAPASFFLIQGPAGKVKWFEAKLQAKWPVKLLGDINGSWAHLEQVGTRGD